MSAAERRIERFVAAERDVAHPGMPTASIPRLRHSWKPLATSTTTSELRLADGRIVVFHEEQEERVSREGSVRYYSLPALNIEGSGLSLVEARQAAAKAVWDEADRWLHTPSHKLSRDEIKRKCLVLGIVDVLKSQIAQRKRKTVSILGEIERDSDGSAWFRESSTEGKRFAFDPELEKTLPNDSYLRIGKQRTGPFGVPVGPIVELGEPLDIPAANEDVARIMQGNAAPDLHDEHNQWMRYVASLDERIARGEMTALQCQVFRGIWDRARDVFPKLRYPSVGCTSERRLHLGWSFTDIPGITFTIDIERDGDIEWFFHDTTLSVVLGTDENPENNIADETLNLLAHFQ